VLVLRHENAVLRTQAGRMRYEPTDQAILSVVGVWRPDRRVQDVSPSLVGIGSGLTRRIALEVYSAS
jgi:hypothetical protein